MEGLSVTVHDLRIAENAAVYTMIRARDAHARVQRALIALHEERASSRELAAAAAAIEATKRTFEEATRQYHMARALLVCAEGIPGLSPENPVIID